MLGFSYKNLPIISLILKNAQVTTKKYPISLERIVKFLNHENINKYKQSTVNKYNVLCIQCINKLIVCSTYVTIYLFTL